MKKMVLMAMAGCLVFAAASASAEELRLSALMDPTLVADSSVVSLRLDDPQEEEGKAKKRGEWGGFGGPLLQYLVLDLDPLDPMTHDRKIDRFESDMLLVGGIGGLIYKNFRFGGFGFGNSQDVADRDAAGERISADMSIGGGGLFFEMNQTVNPNFGVAAGAMLGAGNIELKASGPDLGPDEKWDGDGDFFIAYPYLGAWVAPTSWMWVQLNGGYMFYELEVRGSEAKNDLGVKMIDDDLSGGFMAGLSVNFGHNPNR